MSPKLKYTAKIFIVCVTLTLGYKGICYFSHKRALKKGQDYVAKNLWGLAAHQFDKILYSFTPSNESCSLITASYFITGQARKLEFASQYCMNAEIMTPEVIMAGASAYLLRNQYSLALKHLAHFEKLLSSNIQYYYELANVLGKMNRENDAFLVMLDAAKVFLKEEKKVIQIFSWIYQRKKFKKTLNLAKKLHLFGIQDTALNFQLADIFFMTGEIDLGLKAIEAAFSELNKLPQAQQLKINQQYSYIIRQRDDILKERSKE